MTSWPFTLKTKDCIRKTLETVHMDKNDPVQFYTHLSSTLLTQEVSKSSECRNVMSKCHQKSTTWINKAVVLH